MNIILFSAENNKTFQSLYVWKKIMHTLNSISGRKQFTFFQMERKKLRNTKKKEEKQECFLQNEISRPPHQLLLLLLLLLLLVVVVVY